MELSQKLKQARLDAGLSQKALCGDRITRNMLSQIENGSARPSMDTLRYLATQLGKPLSFFLEEDAVTSPNQALMEKARTAEPSDALHLLGQYKAPDPTFDAERWLLEALVCLQLADDAITQGKPGYARTLLERAGVATGEGYLVSCPLTDKPVDGMTITVDHVVVNEEVYTVEVPFGISTVEDPYLPEGEEKILTAGVVGQELHIADVEYRNAEEIRRTIKDKELIRLSQNQVVAVGTGELVGKTEEMPLIGEDVIVLPSGEVLTYYSKDSYIATAYTQYDAGCDTITACQTQVRWGVVAVDPSVIPYGTRMFIVNADGSFVYGIGTAEDCGGAIKGKRLDLYMPTLSEAYDYGRQAVTVYFLGDANRTY